MRNIRVSMLALIFLFALAHPAFGMALQLKITGKITNFTNPTKREYRLTEQEILSMEKNSIRTSTNWTSAHNFSGFRVMDLLKKVGATGTHLEIHCLDDYIYTIPISDISKYGAILAYEKDGNRITIKEFGPLGLIYPRDQYPTELSGPEMDAKSTWHVTHIVVK